MDLESLKKAIVDEVLRRLGELSRGNDRAHGELSRGDDRPSGEISRANRALAVVTGVPTDPAEVLSRIEATRRAGFRVTALLSKAAAAALPPDQLARYSGGAVLAGGGEPAPALANGADLVVVPWLSLNTASKVANLICDTQASSTLVLALLLGKPVIACADEFDPRNDSNLMTRDLWKRSPVLHRAIIGLCEKLRAYGVRLVSGREFPSALAGWSLREEPTPNSRPGAVGTEDRAGGEKRRVLTREDVVVAINRGEPIRLTPGSILTPLAREVVESHGWPVIEEGPRCGRDW